MNFPHFLRIEHERRDGSHHFVVHTHEPKFSLELAPGGSVLKRVCVPNSWAGDYGQYAKLISVAQDFFTQSSAVPVPPPKRGGL